MSASTLDDATVDELTRGCRDTGNALQCLFCDASFEHGHVYRSGDDLVTAEVAMARHQRDAHGSTFAALLALGKKGTGLPDAQRALLGLLHEGLTDRQIQQRLGGVSLSTVRNHRFNLRERARQARVFLALMDRLERADLQPGQQFIAIPGTKAADDERFAITQAEYERIVHAAFPDGPDGKMTSFPKREKRKIALMIHVLKRFDPSRRYTEREVDEVLATATDDHGTLRRFMVDYGFLGRTRDGAEYWVE
jgi:hypothetical protein